MIYKELNPNNLHISDVEKLYILSFPEDERRDFDIVLQLLEKNKFFRIIVVFSDDDEFLGFISFWEFDSFIYVEHFAIMPEMHGKKIGEQILKHLADNSPKPIILEVEPPLDEMSKRRINFYQRNGYKLHPEVKYIQPPYSNERNAIELKLMTFRDISLHDNCDEIKTIHREVYGVK